MQEQRREPRRDQIQAQIVYLLLEIEMYENGEIRDWRSARLEKCKNRGMREIREKRDVK